MKNKKFIIKPEDGVVVGIFTEDNNGFSRILREATSDASDIQKDIVMALCSYKGYLWDNKPIRSVARCSSDDEWNEEIGKKVAETKLDLKRHVKLIRQYDVLIGELHKLENKLYERQQDHVDKFEKINDDLDHYFRGKVD